MKRIVSVGLMTASAVAAAVGLASSASAGITLDPSATMMWTGGPVPTPGGYAWTWNTASSGGNPAIDSAGRVYWVGQVNSSPAIGSISAAQGPRGFFTGTSAADFQLMGTIHDGGSTGVGDNIYGAQNSTGVFNLTGINSGVKVAGTTVGTGFGMQGTGVAFTGTGQNNSFWGQGTFAGGISNAVQRLATVTLNNTSGSPTSANISTEFRNISHQSSSMNSAGAFAFLSAVPAAAGSFVTGNPTAAPFGNTGFIGVVPAGGGSLQVIAQGGQSAPGGGLYRNGTAGLDGFNIKLNRNGQAYYDARLVNTGLITTTNDHRGYIWTPGIGSQLIYREGAIAPDASGSPDAGGALFSGQMSTQFRSYSNAGVLYTGTLVSGDVTTTDPNTRNDSGLYIANTDGTTATNTRVYRRNDVAPGFVAGDNVRMGNTISGYGMNNAGQVLFASTLQGSGVTANVSAQLAGFPPSSVLTAGTMGNDTALFTGTAGSLAMIARAGDLLPFSSNLRFGALIGNGSYNVNNNGDIIFDNETTYYAPGDAIGITGGPLSSILPSGPRVLMSYTSAHGLVPLLYAGQTVEVASGVFRTLSQWTINNLDNADGGSLGFNDNGTIVAKLTFVEGGYSIVTFQVPAPGTGALALLGLGAMARRRRRN